jgi:subtilisin family serine protease
MISETFDATQGAYVYPTRVTSVESDMEDCINDGIILVGAAGNYYHKIDTPTGLDYNNYFVSSLFGNSYYHRGSTPGSAIGAICVGAIDYDYTSGQERVTEFTEKGPRIDIYAPGRLIQSAIPVGGTLSTGAQDYPTNASYKVKKISGTSMACPQVAGIIATLLEARPNYTAADCLAWLQEQAATGRLNDPTTGTPSTDYVNYRALQGSSNYYLQTPFTSQYVYQYQGGGTIST